MEVDASARVVGLGLGWNWGGRLSVLAWGTDEMRRPIRWFTQIAKANAYRRAIHLFLIHHPTHSGAPFAGLFVCGSRRIFFPTRPRTTAFRGRGQPVRFPRRTPEPDQADEDEDTDEDAPQSGTHDTSPPGSCPEASRKLPPLTCSESLDTTSPHSDDKRVSQQPVGTVIELPPVVLHTARLSDPPPGGWCSGGGITAPPPPGYCSGGSITAPPPPGCCSGAGLGADTAYRASRPISVLASTRPDSALTTHLANDRLPLLGISLDSRREPPPQLLGSSLDSCRQTMEMRLISAGRIVPSAPSPVSRTSKRKQQQQPEQEEEENLDREADSGQEEGRGENGIWATGRRPLEGAGIDCDNGVGASGRCPPAFDGGAASSGGPSHSLLLRAVPLAAGVLAEVSCSAAAMTVVEVAGRHPSVPASPGPRPILAALLMGTPRSSRTCSPQQQQRGGQQQQQQQQQRGGQQQQRQQQLRGEQQQQGDNDLQQQQLQGGGGKAARSPDRDSPSGRPHSPPMPPTSTSGTVLAWDRAWPGMAELGLAG